MSQSEISGNADAKALAAQMMTLLKKLVLACGLTLFATVIFVVALLVTLPATVATEFVTLPSKVTGLYGSLCRGRANLVGGYTLAWDARPTSLVLARLEFDVVLQGSDTQLDGDLTVSSIYGWYRDDFGGKAGVFRHAAPFAEPELRAILQGRTDWDDTDYDWDLNDAE